MISAFSTDMGVLPQLAVRRAGIARPLDGLPEVGMTCGDSICASDTPRSASATTSLIRRQLARTLHESSMPQLPTWGPHTRSDARRYGKTCDMPFRTQRSPIHTKKKQG